MRIRYDPLRGLEHRREILAWSMYDLANQSFALIVVTTFFGIYVNRVIAPSEAVGARWWGAIAGLGMLGAVALGPILGAIADERAAKKRFLVGTGLLCSTLTCCLALLGPGMLWWAAVIFIPASVAFNLGENFLGAFLPEIARPGQMGRVSAIGWTFGYLGALVLLVLSMVIVGLFGLSDPEQWRPLMVLAGAWFLLAMVPTMVVLREKARPSPRRALGAVRLGVARLGETIRDARRFRHLLVFLAVFFVYSIGTQSVIYFAGVIVMQDFGFGIQKLLWFMLQLSLTAGAAAIVTGRVQDRIGHRLTVHIFLAIWTASTLGLAVLVSDPNRPEWVFWVLSNGVGFGLGGIGTSSRALIGTFTPSHKTAEFFGLWGMTYKFAGVVGPLTFGLLKAGLGGSSALILLTSSFGAGFVLMFLVDERAGRESAEAAEREAGAAADALDAAAAARAGAPIGGS